MLQQVRKVVMALEQLKRSDEQYIDQTIPTTVQRANSVDRSTSAGLGFILAQYSGTETTIWFELLVLVLLSSRGDTELCGWNPFLRRDKIRPKDGKHPPQYPALAVLQVEISENNFVRDECFCRMLHLFCLVLRMKLRQLDSGFLNLHCDLGRDALRDD